MKKLGKAFVALSIGGVVLLGGVAIADVSMAVKDRQENMKKFGGNMKAIAGFVKNDEGTAEDVAMRAEQIANWAKNIPTWFPEGTSMEEVSDPETGAKPAIWQDWAKFEAAAQNLSMEAAKLADVAKGGDKGAIAAQFGAMGKNGCGGCHQPFREKLD